MTVDRRHPATTDRRTTLQEAARGPGRSGRETQPCLTGRCTRGSVECSRSLRSSIISATRWSRTPSPGRDRTTPPCASGTPRSLARLPGLKFMRTLWVCDVSGGPFEYVGTKPGHDQLGLESAHRELGISPDEFDAVAQELSRTLDDFNVPTQEKSEVLAAFAAHKGEVTEGSLAVEDLTGPSTDAKEGRQVAGPPSGSRRGVYWSIIAPRWPLTLAGVAVRSGARDPGRGGCSARS